MRKMVLLTILACALLAGSAMAADLTPIGQSCTAGAPLLAAAPPQTVPFSVSPACGACNSTSMACRTERVGAWCGNVDGTILFCQDTGTTCQDGKPICLCAAQPIG